MKKILLMAVMTAALATTASAGSPVFVGTPNVVLPATTNWSGNYVGGEVSTAARTVSAYVGHYYDMGTVVVGAEAGVSHGFSSGSTTASLVGIAGVDLGTVMPYLSGGWNNTGAQKYGVGLNYKLSTSTTLGANWSNTGGTNSFGARVSFGF